MARAKLDEVSTVKVEVAAALVGRVSAATGVARKFIYKGEARDHNWARHVSMWLCRYEGDMTLYEIAALFDRDHSSVSSAIRHVDAEIGTGTRRALLATTLRRL